MPNPEKVRFVFEYDPTYRLHPANGLWGGLTSKGDLRIDFYVESFKPPSAVIHSIGSDGVLSPELEREPPRQLDAVTVTRLIQVGILIEGSQIETFANFLSQKANELKGLTATDAASASDTAIG